MDQTTVDAPIAFPRRETSVEDLVVYEVIDSKGDFVGEISKEECGNFVFFPEGIEFCSYSSRALLLIAYKLMELNTGREIK